MNVEVGTRPQRQRWAKRGRRRRHGRARLYIARLFVWSRLWCLGERIGSAQMSYLWRALVASNKKYTKKHNLYGHAAHVSTMCDWVVATRHRWRHLLFRNVRSAGEWHRTVDRLAPGSHWWLRWSVCANRITTPASATAPAPLTADIEAAA